MRGRVGRSGKQRGVRVAEKGKDGERSQNGHGQVWRSLAELLVKQPGLAATLSLTSEARAPGNSIWT